MKKHITLNYILSCVLVVVAVVSAVRMFSVQILIDRSKVDTVALEREIELQQQRNDKLQAGLDAVFDDEYIMNVARKELGYVLPGERIFEDISGQ